MPTVCGSSAHSPNADAALVVDEDEVDAQRGVRGGQRGDETAQQLALAGAGGARHQPVRPVAHQVDVERAVLGQREARHQAGLPAGGRPAPAQVLAVRLADPQQ